MANQSETIPILLPRPYPGLLSLVIPNVQRRSRVSVLAPALEQFMSEVSCETEIVLVNDGSSDKTLAGIAGWAKEDLRVKVIHLSRNFGHQIACTSTLQRATQWSCSMPTYSIRCR